MPSLKEALVNCIAEVNSAFEIERRKILRACSDAGYSDSQYESIVKGLNDRHWATIKPIEDSIIEIEKQELITNA